MVQRYVIEMDGSSIESPRWCNHKRGSNWAAKLDGPNAARMERQYLPRRGRTVDLSMVSAGDVVELAGDYTSSGGRREPNREYWHVVEIDHATDRLVIDEYATPAKAIRAARLARAAAEAAQEPPASMLETPMPGETVEVPS
jgi:hypothetical protein